MKKKYKEQPYRTYEKDRGSPLEAIIVITGFLGAFLAFFYAFGRII